MTTVPLVGGSSVVIIRISVDLPAPFGPSRPKISPSSTAKLMPLTAVKVAERLDDALDVDGDGHIGSYETLPTGSST